MIPPVIPSSCPSPGEREIFTRLRDEPGTKDWIVLHSLDIARHVRQIAGEADFVVIAPALGVLCLEVKACQSVQRISGMWYYGRDPHGDPRGPFKQASEAMHSLRQQVVRVDSTLSRIPFWSAVVFPFTEFKTSSSEWHSWQVIDSARFRRHPFASLVAGILRSARAFLSAQPGARWFSETDRLPNPQQAAAVARVLRPCFEFRENAPERRARQQVEILRYTEEQFAALDTMADNDRVLFTGPAGTGKTLLALEVARRAASSGQRVLFVCYNRFLGQWLSRQSAAWLGNGSAGTFHQYLLGVARTSPPPEPVESFWNSELPHAVVGALLSGHTDASAFDMIIVDEVQDLLCPQYLDVMDLVLRGGLAGGRWRMFGDFERQMIYGQDRSQTDQLLSVRLGSFARGALRVNCRNTPRVATLSHLLGRLTPNYSRVLRPDDRIEPVIRYYATPSQQRKEVASILDRLFKESYSSEDIVVLSPKAGSRCAAASVTEKPWCDQLASFEAATTGQIRYTTIQSFKGLDAPAIIVTDIEHVASDMFASLFYVATTRALEQLCIIVHETAKADIVESLLGGTHS